MKKKKNNKIGLLIFILIVSLILYFTGVFSGIYANKIIKRNVNAEISEIQDNLDLSAVDIKNIQLQQFFINYYEGSDKCDFLNVYTNQLYPQLEYYWNILPTRLEEYDKKTKLTPEYLSLKREYIRLSLRFWTLTSQNYNDCNNHNFIPILYFYTSDCENCTEQGIEFDKFSQEMQNINKTVIVFPIDANFEDDTVFLLKTYYKIENYPAVIIRDRLLQDKILTNNDLKFLFDVK